MKSFMSKYLTSAAIAATLCFSLVPHASAADTSSQDKKFVTDSGVGSLAEIQMAKLALKNSQNKEVRAFAQKMIKDHTMLIEQMKPFADKMGVPPPSKLEHAEQEEYDRLAAKKGASFDKDYVQTMVDDHHKDYADFSKEYNSTANMELKATVAKGGDVIKGHTEMIDALGRKMSLKIPSGD